MSSLVPEVLNIVGIECHDIGRESISWKERTGREIAKQVLTVVTFFLQL